MSATDFQGMCLSDAAAVLGKPEQAARVWLYHRGYHNVRGKMLKRESVYDVEDAIVSRLSTNAPVQPCWRCGARSGCGHR